MSDATPGIEPKTSHRASGPAIGGNPLSGVLRAIPTVINYAADHHQQSGPPPRRPLREEANVSTLPAFGTKKIRREDLPPGGNLCEHCTAKCCHYIAVPYETPTERDDMEYIRWIVLHHNATFFKEEDDWYLLVHTVCEKLQDDYRCGVYETRPKICRDYTFDNCEYRRRLDVRLLPGNARAGLGVHRGALPGEGRLDPQSAAEPAGGGGLTPGDGQRADGSLADRPLSTCRPPEHRLPRE